MLTSVLDILAFLSLGTHNFFVVSPCSCLTCSPRLVGTVELRSNGLDPIAVSYVSISLNQFEKILAPSKSGAPLAITSTKIAQQRVIGKEVMLYQAPIGSQFDAVTSLDLPFVIEIPNMYEELPAASLMLPNGVCETT